MGSIVTTTKIDKASGKKVTVHRAHVRRVGFKSKSKVFENKRDATEWLRNNDADSTLEKPVSGTTLRDLIEDFVQAPPTKGTRYWAASHLDFWREQIGGMLVAKIARGDINRAKAKLQIRPKMRSVPGGAKLTDEKLTPATVNRYLASLASVFNYAVDNEVVDVHPMKAGKVSKLKESGGRTRILNADEESRLMAAARASTWPMLHLFVRMCLTTAARRGEVLKLHWRDVRLDDSIAILAKTKNDTARAMPLVSDVKAALVEAQKVRPMRGDFVFFNPKDPTRPFNPESAWRKCRADAGVLNDREDPLDRVVLHTTRHTSVTKMIKGGANLAEAAVVSGHKTLAMLKRYEHLAAQDAVAIAERHLAGASDV